MDSKERVEGLLLKTATEILIADIQNGYRNYWIYNLEPERVEKLVNQSFEIAKKLFDKCRDVTIYEREAQK